MKRQYHKYDSCNKCGGNNDYEVTDTIESHVSECRTKCKDCGFTDYWSTGFFESSQYIESKCKTYGAVITPPELTIEITALKECISNYEDAMREQQKLTIIAEKRANDSDKKLARLIKLVTHNAKNSETILNQL